MNDFLNTATANPMHNTLRRTVETLSQSTQEKLAQHWEVFFQYFQNRCNQAIKNATYKGLYEVGAFAIMHACAHMQRVVHDTDLNQMFAQLGENIADTIEKYEEIDAHVDLYWNAFAEQYRNCMPHCNNQVFSDFQQEVAAQARQLYHNNPDVDIQLTALSAVQYATIHVARKGVHHPGIGADMTAVSQMAAEQKEMLSRMQNEIYEPRDYISDVYAPTQDDIEVEEML